MNRRIWLKSLVSIGIGSALFQRALAAQAQDAVEVTAEMIQQAQWVAGVELTEQERSELVDSLSRKQAVWQSVREIRIDPSEAPTVHFQPVVPPPALGAKSPFRFGMMTDKIGIDEAPTSVDGLSETDLAFLPLTHLANLLRTRQITSVQLTQIYLARLKRFNPLLNCVVNLTEALAMQQAAEADREISAGRYRGPLHGIPWGAKDLISVPGYPTTWGAPQFKDQQLTGAATVYQKLSDAGAVLVAKLSLGALAMGDQWFGGLTRNPWNPERGSSGSSAGSASAVAAGLVGFAIGTETLGSILSPSRVCGTVGLRPSFGAVSRHGCMPLSWTMDKVGPITRSTEDAFVVFEAIKGPDGLDPTVSAHDFPKLTNGDNTGVRIGYVVSPRQPDDQRQDLSILRDLGYQLVKITLPEEIPAWPLTMVLEVEGASVFEHWLKQGDVEGWNTWPQTFRSAQFVTAVDYLRAQRLRGRLITQMESLFVQVDVLVNANDLVITNLTGHPSLSLPSQYTQRRGITYPLPTVFTSRLFAEDLLASVATNYQRALPEFGRRPDLEGFLKRQIERENRQIEPSTDRPPTPNLDIVADR